MIGKRSLDSTSKAFQEPKIEDDNRIWELTQSGGLLWRDGWAAAPFILYQSPTLQDLKSRGQLLKFQGPKKIRSLLELGYQNKARNLENRFIYNRNAVVLNLYYIALGFPCHLVLSELNQLFSLYSGEELTNQLLYRDKRTRKNDNRASHL